jgi:hypothetical protein
MASGSHGAPASATTTPKRLTPSQISLAIGGLLAVVVIASGIWGGLINTDKGDETVTRHVFENIPGPMVAAFYVTLPALFLMGGWLMSQRVKNWERGGPDDRRTTKKNVTRRMADFRAGVYM